MSESESAPLQASYFTLELDSTEYEGVIRVGVPEHTTEESQIASASAEEAGDEKEGAITGFGDLTVERIIDEETVLWDWIKMILDGNTDEGIYENCAVNAKQADGTMVTRYNFTNVWPKEYDVSSFSADSNDVATETVTLVVEEMVVEPQ